MPVERFQTEVGGQEITLEVGRMAGLADGAVVVSCGETVVLSTATTSEEPREGIDFFPLTVEFEEKMYAAGKIPGGFLKRESRPTDQAILTARLTDRPLRPLFPKDYRNDVQVVSTVLSTDQVSDPSTLSIIGASAALHISDIPFFGPVGAVRMGYLEGALMVNPGMPQVEFSMLDLTLAGTADAILMVEAGAYELPEAQVLESLQLGHQAMQPVIELQNRMRERVGKPKREYVVAEIPSELTAAIQASFSGRLAECIFDPNKAGREDATRQLKLEAIAHFQEQYDPKVVARVFEKMEKDLVRNAILEGRRPDGRGPTEIRPITIEVGVLPRAHGSALFTRGQTQALSVATLGTDRDEQRLDNIGLQESKRYLHHYNFPPFSVGETRPMRGPSRRDIGHGALAERALMPVLPDETESPYTIRVVSEILSSNGSTSMASVCGSTLALMDAGVQIKSPVAGIAMGLVTPPDGNLDRYAILTDIQGMEDMLGDMDFKVAGTQKGITALQMDIKLRGLTQEIVQQAMAQAREARLFVLGKMLEALPRPRAEVSARAPRITTIRIHPDKIRDVIGPGGKMIRKIVEETKTTINVEDDGRVNIGSTNPENAQKAIEIIERLTRVVEAGQTYTGKVTRLMNFGAFVEILPGKDGLVHISQLARTRVNRVEDVVNVGDEVTVVVTEIDRQGRVNLSRRALLPPVEGEEEVENEEGGPPRPPQRSGFDRRGGFDRGGGGGGGGGFRSPRRDDDRRGPGGPGQGPRPGGWRPGPPEPRPPQGPRED